MLCAIFVYDITVETGKFEIVKHTIASLADDRRIQALLIAFSFGAFIEGAAGFGTSAKARLDEAEATLRRTRKLVELGAGAGKDLITAETAYKTAKAEYDFQSNISLNRELQEARAAVETTRVDVAHIRDEMRALGAPVPVGEDDHSKDTSVVPVRAPLHWLQDRQAAPYSL